MAASQRVKIEPQYPTNLLFVKILTDWKSNAADNKHAYTIKKALTALSKCPLPLNNYTDLKELKGIGVDIATRLDAALRCYIEQVGDVPRLDAVRSIKKGEAILYLREAAVSRGNRRIPFIPKPEKNTKSQSAIRQDSFERPVEANLIPSTSFSQPVSNSVAKPLTIPLSQQPKLFSSKGPQKQIIDNVIYDPILHPNAQVTLIVDAREERSHSSKKSISELLTKTSIRYEMRPLVVGDYLWVLRLDDSTENELVLDYIVERKTWDDLKIEGHSFAWFQDESKKTKEISVMDCFIKQLTVCPRMSTAKACIVAAQYPSLKALRRLYETRDPDTPYEDVLSNAIPSIPPSLSRQIAAFFRLSN